MKVHEYNEMMAYMLRPQPKEEIQVASLMDEYLGDQKEYQKAVDEGFQGTFEEYLRMKSLERKELAIGGGVIEGEDLGSREGFAAPDSGIPPRKIFEKEYKKFKGSDREFAEFLNKKYKTNTNTTSSVESMRRRLGLKTVNPKTTGDYKGLEKYIKNFKGDFRPGLFEIANRFGFKDKGVVEKMINRVNPDMKKATPPGRLPPGVETKEAKLKREIEERKAERKKKEKTKITEKQFKQEYKKFKPEKTGSDFEFADYLNKKTKYTAYRGEPFTGRIVNQFRRDFGLESKMFTTRAPKFSDEFILKEADRMKLNVDRSDPKKLRQAVIQAISREKGLTPDEKQKLYDARVKAAAPKPQRQFPYNIGKKPEPKDLFWKDLLENAQRHQGFLINREGPKLAESHIKFKNPNQVRPTDIKSVFNIELIDTNVVDKKGNPKVLTYDNFLKHIDDNKKLYGIDSETALQEYKKKRFIQENPDLRDQYNLKVNKAYDPLSATSRAVFSPMHIHHTAGRGRNAFNVQFAVATENMDENRFRTTLNRKFKAAKNFGERRAAVREYLSKVPPNLEVRLKNTPYGQRETLIDMTKRIAPELTKDVKRAGGVKLGVNPFLDPKAILTGLGDVARFFGTPSVAATFAGTTIKENLEQGDSLLDAATDKMVGIDLLYPEIAKQTVGRFAQPTGRGILSMLGRVAMNPFGRAARAFTPVGAGITAIGLGKDYYDFIQRDLARKAADPEAYAAEQEEQMGISA